MPQEATGVARLRFGRDQIGPKSGLKDWMNLPSMHSSSVCVWPHLFGELTAFSSPCVAKLPSLFFVQLFFLHD